MKNFNISMIALAIGLTFSAGAMAESMSKNQYESHVKNIKANYKPFVKTGYDARIIKADAHKSAASDKRDADYAVAKGKCRVQAGAAKDQCMSDAKIRFGQQFKATMMPLAKPVVSSTTIQI